MTSSNHTDRNQCRLSGIGYREFLTMLGSSLACRTYFEVGTDRGDTLNGFRCDTVCVDPHFQVTQNVLVGKKKTFFFQMTSDEFFDNYDLRTFMPRGPDVAFLDGLHLFENLLRDFINTEKSCHYQSVIALHDCLPLNERMAEREFRFGEDEDGTGAWWTGDVWRLLLVLKKYRSDLRVRIFDCPPTGLTVCTRVDYVSRVLSDHYAKIIDEFATISLASFGLKNLWSLFQIVDTQALVQSPSQIPLVLGLEPGTANLPRIE